MPRNSDVDQKLMNFFASQRLPDQARIPPERELAGLLGLTRGQLRTGLARLKANGKLWGHVGKGTFIGRQPLNERKALLELSMLSNPRDVIEVRLAIEPMLASLAAVRGTLNDFARMDKAVRHSRTASDRATFQRCDDLFHGAVAEAAANPLLLAIYRAVNESRRGTPLTNTREKALSVARKATYIEQHAACLAAMRDRDPRRAAAIMRQHLEFISSICDVFGSKPDAHAGLALTGETTSTLEAVTRWGRRLAAAAVGSQ